MNINLPLILTLAVLITGLIWLFDALVWARPRKARMAAVDQQFADFLAQPQPGADADTPTRTAWENRKAAYDAAQASAAWQPGFVEFSRSFFPVLALVFVLRSFIAEPFQIPSGSMEPTLDIGDFILVNKYTYGIRLPVINKKIISVNDPQRGDVMVFFPPHLPKTYFIKRVIGLPGDEIEYRNHELFINGKKVEESDAERLPAGSPYYRKVRETIGDKTYTTNKNLIPGQLSGEPRRGFAGKWTVPAGHYFMMGDNRDHSSDSREWLFVSEEAIVGKAFAIWMHWDSLFSIPSFDRVGKIE